MASFGPKQRHRPVVVSVWVVQVVAHARVLWSGAAVVRCVRSTYLAASFHCSVGVGVAGGHARTRRLEWSSSNEACGRYVPSKRHRSVVVSVWVVRVVAHTRLLQSGAAVVRCVRSTYLAPSFCCRVGVGDAGGGARLAWRPAPAAVTHPRTLPLDCPHCCHRCGQQKLML